MVIAVRHGETYLSKLPLYELWSVHVSDGIMGRCTAPLNRLIRKLVDNSQTLKFSALRLLTILHRLPSQSSLMTQQEIFA